MATTMDPHEAIALIKSNLAEVLNPEIIDDVILSMFPNLLAEEFSPSSFVG